MIMQRKVMGRSASEMSKSIAIFPTKKIFGLLKYLNLGFWDKGDKVTIYYEADGA